MAITRRTERFARIAAEVEAECRRRGLQVDPAVVDLALNEQITLVASLMRVGERAAFAYCPDDIAPQLAASIDEAVHTGPA